MTMHRAIETFKPTAVIVDPVSNLIASGTLSEVNAMLVRLVDHLKRLGLTGVYTSLSQGNELEQTGDAGLSSLMDTWLLLSTVELGGERNRVIAVLKSRGMAHSNQVREFILTDDGVRLVDVYAGPEGVLTGSARQAQEAREQAATVARQQATEAQRRGLDRQRQVMEAEIAALRARFAAQTAETSTVIAQEEGLGRRLEQDREAMGDRRRPDPGSGLPPPKRAKKAGV
jgi:circadian clock protein KaiC